jgi:DNA repair protein RecO (recombination protein O)
VSASERVDLEPAFVLHAMPYRETSEILELLTPRHGRISVVARGMRRPRSPMRSLLQPFQLLTVSWSGRGPLFSLRSVESSASAVPLAELALMSAFYVNELLMNFLHRGDPHPELFAVYRDTLRALAAGHEPEAVLRRFELGLLAEAGFGLSLECEADNGGPIDPARQYQYVIEHGPLPASGESGNALRLSGAALLAIGRGDFTNPEHLLAARRLLRAVLEHHLGGKVLRTREVYAAMRG